MKKLLLILAPILFSLRASAAPQQAVATVRIVSAADAFLASLDAGQREKVVYAFDDNEQRARWSNFPTGFIPRGGINFKQMTVAQREAAMKLMTTVLSPMGLEKVEEIRQADDDFKANGSKRGPGGGRGVPPPGGGSNGGPPPGGFPPGGPGGGRGGRPPGGGGDMFGSDLYYISFLGKPSTSAPWMLQFGGHHLALNITIMGEKGVLTPTLTGGSQPRSS